MGPEDRSWLDTKKTELASRRLCYSLPPNSGAPGASQGAQGACGTVPAAPLFWGDWFVPGQKVYREAPPKQQLLKLLHVVSEETVSRLQVGAEASGSASGAAAAAATPQIVFFVETVEHVVALCRALGKPQGHALLLGFGATGKQTVARLTACIRDFTLVRERRRANVGKATIKNGEVKHRLIQERKADKGKIGRRKAKTGDGTKTS